MSRRSGLYSSAKFSRSILSHNQLFSIHFIYKQPEGQQRTRGAYGTGGGDTVGETAGRACEARRGASGRILGIVGAIIALVLPRGTVLAHLTCGDGTRPVARHTRGAWAARGVGRRSSAAGVRPHSAHVARTRRGAREFAVRPAVRATTGAAHCKLARNTLTLYARPVALVSTRAAGTGGAVHRSVPVRVAARRACGAATHSLGAVQSVTSTVTAHR